MTRREIIAAAGAGFTVAAFPLITVVGTVPHVYMAASTAYPHGWELETWRHSDDRSWVRDILIKDMAYEDRHELMNEFYLWGRPR